MTDHGGRECRIWLVKLAKTIKKTTATKSDLKVMCICDTLSLYSASLDENKTDFFAIRQLQFINQGESFTKLEPLGGPIWVKG